MSDAELKELQEYLTQILSTTFILDDNTRVKTVYISWDDLAPKQRQFTLEAIKKNAISEIKQLKGKGKLRFEFNEIPDDLEEMLINLAGHINEDFKWIQLMERNKNIT